MCGNTLSDIHLAFEFKIIKIFNAYYMENINNHMIILISHNHFENLSNLTFMFLWNISQFMNLLISIIFACKGSFDKKIISYDFQ